MRTGNDRLLRSVDRSTSGICWLDKKSAIAVYLKLKGSIREKPKRPLLKGAAFRGELSIHLLQQLESRIDQSDRAFAPWGAGEVPKESAAAVHAVWVALPGDLQRPPATPVRVGREQVER